MAKWSKVATSVICGKILITVGRFLVNSFNAGKVCMLFCRLWIFFLNKLFQKMFQEYHQCQTVWIEVRLDILLGLVWVQTVCKGDQQMTKVATSGEIVKLVILLRNSCFLHKSNLPSIIYCLNTY